MTTDFQRITELLQTSGLDERVVRAMINAGKREERECQRQRNLSASQQNLVHNLFTAAELIRSLTLQRLTDKGFQLDQFTWIGREDPPEYTDDPQVAVVLEVTLADLVSTVKFAYKWASEGKPGNRFGPIELSKKRLHPSPDSEPFQPFTLRWRLLKLEEHCDLSLRNRTFKRDAQLGIAALFAAAQHPKLVKAEQAKETVWVLPGLNHPGLDADTLHLCFRKRPAGMWLYDFPQMPTHPTLVIPVFHGQTTSPVTPT